MTLARSRYGFLIYKITKITYYYYYGRDEGRVRDGRDSRGYGAAGRVRDGRDGRGYGAAWYEW